MFLLWASALLVPGRGPRAPHWLALQVCRCWHASGRTHACPLASTGLQGWHTCVMALCDRCVGPRSVAWHGVLRHGVLWHGMVCSHARA